MLLTLLGGCAEQPVPVDEPALEAGPRQACRELLDSLPAELAGEAARETEPRDVLAAAYGDPPIVVSCAPKPPPQFTAFSACDEVNGVGWFIPDKQVHDPRSDVELWAVSYQPVLLARVPAGYRPEGPAAVLAELAEPVRKHLTRARECR